MPSISAIFLVLMTLSFSQLPAGAAESTPVIQDNGCAPKEKLDLVDEATRMKSIADAQIFDPRDISQLDTQDGPQIKHKTLPNDASVDCQWLHGKDGGGTTPKFHCKLIKAIGPDGTVYLPKGVSASDAGVAAGTHVVETKIKNLKIRYNDPKTLVEVMADRLEWTLGFGSDTETPLAQVNCQGCAKNPFTQKTPASGSTSFSQVSAELPMKGTGIYVKGTRYAMDAGKDEAAWTWSEADAITDPAKKAQVEALELLEAFLGNPDTKTIQNKLICKSKLDKDGQCPDPAMYVHDLGASFGSDNHKIIGMFREPDAPDLKAWSAQPVWKSGTSCVAQLNMVSKHVPGLANNGAGLVNPNISEAGRALLADRLSSLISDQNLPKLKDIFEAAHIEKHKDHGQYYTADQWVDAFKQKAEQIINHHCAQ